MEWQAVSNKIVVSRFYRLEEWPWRFILLKKGPRKLSVFEEKVHLNKRCTFFLYGIRQQAYRAG